MAQSFVFSLFSILELLRFILLMANGVYKNHSRLYGALLSSYTKIGVDTGLEFTAISTIIFIHYCVAQSIYLY